MRASRILVVSFLSILILPFMINHAWPQCGPGEHWIDDCAGGEDTWQNISVELYVDNTGDCEFDGAGVLTGSGLIHRSSPSDDSQNYPGTRPSDGHLDVIDTEILSMDLTTGTETIVIGAGRGQGGNLAPSSGVMAESFSDPSAAESFFDIFCEADFNGYYLYNQNAIRLESVIDQSPPFGSTYTFTGCIPIYTSPIPGEGFLAGYITQINLTVNEDVADVPTLSEWGMLLMGLLLLSFGTVAVVRRRRTAINEIARFLKQR